MKPDHISLRMYCIQQLADERARSQPSIAVIQACETAIKKLDEGGHVKTFAMMSDPDRYEKETFTEK